MTDFNMNKKLLTLALVSLFFLPNAYALDLGHDVTIKGFGTAGLVYSDNNQQVALIPPYTV